MRVIENKPSEQGEFAVVDPGMYNKFNPGDAITRQNMMVADSQAAGRRAPSSARKSDASGSGDCGIQSIDDVGEAPASLT